MINVGLGTIKEPRVYSAVRIGDTNYSFIRRSELGEMFNITVDTVMTRGQSAVRISGPLKDSVIRNINGFDGCTNLVKKSAMMRRCAPADGSGCFFVAITT